MCCFVLFYVVVHCYGLLGVPMSCFMWLCAFMYCYMLLYGVDVIICFLAIAICCYMLLCASMLCYLVLYVVICVYSLLYVAICMSLRVAIVYQFTLLDVVMVCHMVGFCCYMLLCVVIRCSTSLYVLRH